LRALPAPIRQRHCSAGRTAAPSARRSPLLPLPAERRDAALRNDRRRLIPAQENLMTRTPPLSVLALTIALVASAVPALADDAAQVQITLKDHKFAPAEPAVAAGKPIVIQLANQDATPAEFESKELRVEKVVAGGGSITVKVRALKPGRYRFFDDYHEATTQGFLIAQ
jgi:hypothetical protein